MGLDMYLYSYKEVDKRAYKDREYLLEWRKANAIHWWFVSQIQGGVDDWNEYPVPREKLEELMVLCREVHDSRRIESSELMPTMPGPFFGSTDYSDLYYWELKNTAAQLEKLLCSKELESVYFYYQAFW